MDITKIIQLITAGQAIIGAIAELVENTKDVLSSDEIEAIEKALAELQASNDADYARVLTKLQEAKAK